MKKIFLLLLLCTSAIAQNLTLPANSTTTISSGSYSTITFSENSSLINTGNVSIQNLNINGNKAKIRNEFNATMNIGSSINLNGQDSLINLGTIYSKSIDIQNGKSYLANAGYILVQGDVQINDNTSSIKNCGTLKVENYTNLNSTKENAFVFCGCGVLDTYGLNINSYRPFTGVGTIKYKTGNIHNQITNSEHIYVNGKNYLNGKKGECYGDPLPVIVESTEFERLDDTHIKYTIKFSEFTGSDYYMLHYSTNAMSSWETKYIKREDNKLIYTGIIEL